MKLSQISFSRGEISPSAGARTDLQLYAAALKTCRNFFVESTGGASNRAGTEFVYELNAASLAALIPFSYSVDQSYMLVAQAGSFQVYANGGFVQNTTTKTITNISISVGRVKTVTVTGTHGLMPGQSVTISDVNATGSYALSGSSTVASTPTASTFTLTKLAASPVSGSYVSGGIVSIATLITNTYAQDALASIRYTQSANVLTLVHPDYPPAEFTRLTPTSFQYAAIADLNNGPWLDENITSTTVTANGATGTVTLTASAPIFNANHIGAQFRMDLEDLSVVPPWEPSKLLAASGANPVGLRRRASGKVYECATNEVAGADGTYTGTVRPIHEEGTEKDGDGSAIKDLASRAGVEWTYLHSLYGVARITAQAGNTATATVLSYLPVVSAATTKIWSFGAWSEDQGYPSLVTYYQDRLVFANTPGSPQTEWASKTGEYHNFGTSSPLASDDAITQTLNARQINAIVELIPLDQLVALTASSAWASPKRGETWSPQTIGFDPQSYYGASNVRSVIVGNDAIFCERGNRRIRLLSYAYDIDKFGGDELTVLARHLFETGVVVDMDYAADPHGILWVVLSNGELAALTYLKEQQVLGWSRHDTNGFFERVCVIHEDGRDAVYFIVRRTINGATVRYLERLAERSKGLDAFYVDCGLRYDGRNTSSTSMTITGSFVGGEACSIAASDAVFTADDVGDVIQFDELRIVITSYSSAFSVSGTLQNPVPTQLQNIPSAAWTFARDTFTGLDHLEGKEVAIFADGASLARQTVTGGRLTLDYPAGVVCIGLPITAEIETLNVTVFGGETVRDRAKIIPRASLNVLDTLGLKVGPDADHLEDFALRDQEFYNDPTTLQTGVNTVSLATQWDKNGRVLVRQDNPLPATVLAIYPVVEVGGDA